MSIERLDGASFGSTDEPTRGEINAQLFGGSEEKLLKRKKPLIHIQPRIPGLDVDPKELFEEHHINETDLYLLRLLKSEGYLKGHETVLGIGSGTGDLEVYLVEQMGHKGQVLAVDLNGKLLSRNRQKVGQAQRHGRLMNLAFLEWNGEKFPPGWDEVDVALAARVFHHADEKAMLGEAARVTKLGGILGVISRDPLNFSHMSFDAEEIIVPELGKLVEIETIVDNAGLHFHQKQVYPDLLSPSERYQFDISDAPITIPDYGYKHLKELRFIHGSPPYYIVLDTAEARADFADMVDTTADSYRPPVSKADLRRVYEQKIDRSFELVNESIDFFVRIGP